LRIYKVALTWPLEETGARRFAEGLQDVLVVEEKRGFIEDQLVRILYNMDAARRPSVVGKRDETGALLLPSEGELNPTIVASALVARLRRLGHQSPALEQRLARLEAFEHPTSTQAPVSLQLTPFFCSGCPHNTSTKIPDGSRAMAGIGCHGMALSIPSRRTATITHMGGEGANWIGQAPSPASRTSSRISVTAPTRIPACWRCARQPSAASTSPTRSSTTTPSP
jgi:indolepyruvate ferredoxin oxidoreductase